MLSKHCLFFGLFVCLFNPHKNSVEKMIPFFEEKKHPFFFQNGFWLEATHLFNLVVVVASWTPWLPVSLKSRNHPTIGAFLRKQPVFLAAKSPNGTKNLSNLRQPWGVSSLYLYAVYCVILACAILLADKTGQRRRVPRLRIWLKMWGSG